MWKTWASFIIMYYRCRICGARVDSSHYGTQRVREVDAAWCFSRYATMNYISKVHRHLFLLFVALFAEIVGQLALFFSAYHSCHSFLKMFSSGRLAPNTVQTGDISLNGQSKNSLSYGVAVCPSYWISPSHSLYIIVNYFIHWLNFMITFRLMWPKRMCS